MRESPQLILRVEAPCLNVRIWSHMRSRRLWHSASCTAPARHRLPTAPAGYLQPFHGMGHLWTPMPRRLHWALTVYGKSEIPLWFQTLEFSCDRCCHGRQVSEPPTTASRALINTVRGGKDLPRQNSFASWWAKSLPWVSGKRESGLLWKGSWDPKVAAGCGSFTDTGHFSGASRNKELSRQWKPALAKSPEIPQG